MQKAIRSRQSVAHCPPLTADCNPMPFDLTSILTYARYGVALLGAFIAASASIYSKPSDAHESETQTAGKSLPAVYYVK